MTSVRTYHDSADILDKLIKRKGTLKNLCFSRNVQNKPQTYAIVSEVVKHHDLINELITETDIVSSEKDVSVQLIKVLVYDHLFGKGIRGGGALKQLIKRHEEKLQQELKVLMEKHKVDSPNMLLGKDQKVTTQALPRYVRINTIKRTFKETISIMESEGLLITKPNENNVDEEKEKNGKTIIVRRDEHVPMLLAFPPNFDFHKNSLYKDGSLILQDKASCFSALVLSPPPGSFVLDACAAPGNKTSHLAALMKNKGSILAVERDPKRMRLLIEMVHRAGATIVTPVHGDFLAIDPSSSITYSRIEYILCDPSCSGSGLIGRVDLQETVTSKKRSAEEMTGDDDASSSTQKKQKLQASDDGSRKSNAKDPAQRLANLAAFQTSIVLHAMTFPNVKRVVYSTCSIHREENEDVVRKILDSNSKFQLVNALPNWPRRGLPDENDSKNSDNIAQYCVRADPTQDSTNGFFVACFERKKQK